MEVVCPRHHAVAVTLQVMTLMRRYMSHRIAQLAVDRLQFDVMNVSKDGQLATESRVGQECSC